MKNARTPAIVTLILVCALAWVAWNVVQVTDDVRARDDRTTRLENELGAQEAASQALADQLEGLGEKPVVAAPRDGDIPTLIPGPRGPRGAMGPVGPKGRPGVDGKDGATGLRGVTGAPGSNGASGSDGAPGADGKDGATGEPGPAGPKGEPGRDGSNGADGKDGRGITSVACSTAVPLTFTVTYSDGSTETVTCSPSTSLR